MFGAFGLTVLGCIELCLVGLVWLWVLVWCDLVSIFGLVWFGLSSLVMTMISASFLDSQ